MTDQEKKEIDITPWSDFNYVFHTTHFEAAKGILSTRKVMPVPPGDVVWLSPNDLTPSHFGSVRFKFSWPDIFGTNKLFWVGEVQNRRLPTYRMLITGGSGGGLHEYNPKIHVDVIQQHGQSWRRNVIYNLEFQLEDYIDLSKCVAINPVSHSTSCRWWITCKEKWSSGESAGRFLAWLLTKKNKAFNKLLLDDQGQWGGLAEDGYEDICKAFREAAFGGNVTQATEAAVVLRRALLYYGYSSEKVWKELTALCSANLCEQTLEVLFHGHFGLKPSRRKRPV